MPPKKRASILKTPTTPGISGAPAGGEPEAKRASVRISMVARPEEVARIRQNEHHHNLERDNLCEDPSKGKTRKAPDFGLTEDKIKPVSRASKRVLGATQGRYRKNFEQKRQDLLMKAPREGLLYDMLTAPSAMTKADELCETCWEFAKERCSTCLAYVCKKECLEVHRDLRCNKMVR